MRKGVGHGYGFVVHIDDGELRRAHFHNDKPGFWFQNDLDEFVAVVFISNADARCERCHPGVTLFGKGRGAQQFGQRITFLGPLFEHLLEIRCSQFR